MTEQFSRETYFKTLKIVEELKAEKEREKREAEEADEILRGLSLPNSDSTTKEPFTEKLKAFLIAALVITVALIILAGSVVIIPTVLVMVIFYLLFYAAKTSIK